MGLSVSACQAAMRNASLSCGELPPVDGNCYEECEPSAAASDPCSSCDEPSLASPCEPKNVNLLVSISIANKDFQMFYSLNCNVDINKN